MSEVRKSTVLINVEKKHFLHSYTLHVNPQVRSVEKKYFGTIELPK